jgi:hypothetical protein
MARACAALRRSPFWSTLSPPLDVSTSPARLLLRETATADGVLGGKARLYLRGITLR